MERLRLRREWIRKTMLRQGEDWICDALEKICMAMERLSRAVVLRRKARQRHGLQWYAMAVYSIGEGTALTGAAEA